MRSRLRAPAAARRRRLPGEALATLLPSPLEHLAPAPRLQPLQKPVLALSPNVAGLVLALDCQNGRAACARGNEARADVRRGTVRRRRGLTPHRRAAKTVLQRRRAQPPEATPATGPAAPGTGPAVAAARRGLPRAQTPAQRPDAPSATTPAAVSTRPGTRQRAASGRRTVSARSHSVFPFPGDPIRRPALAAPHPHPRKRTLGGSTPIPGPRSRPARRHGQQALPQRPRLHEAQ